MSVSFNDYMPIIYNRLMAEFNNEKGVSALMGNLYAESGCTPYACQPSRPYNVCMTYIANVDSHAISEYNFVHKGCSSTGGIASSQLGFGLAQWTYYTRKQGLYTYMFANGNSIGDLENQIDYVIVEIIADTDLDDAVRNATDLNTATDYLLKHYENPQDQSLNVKKLRRGYAKDIYDAYNGTTPVEPSTPTPPQSGDDPVPTVSAVTRSTMPLWEMLLRRKAYLT